MLRVYHLLLGAILLVVMPLGAKFVLPQFSTKVEKLNPVVKPAVGNSSQTTPAITPTPVEENIWKKILGTTSAPNGWQVFPCQGNAPLLCVSSQGEILGTVEIGVYPVNNNPDFQKNLIASGIPLGSKIDYQSPKHQNQVLAALKIWVADLDTTLAKDRQSTYSNKIVFSAYPPQQVPVGKLQGLRYGFVGLKQEGGVQEQHIGHVAFDGTALYVINTAFDPGSVTGKFEKLENLAIFQPYLDAIAADLNLPM
ncbi:hypothetical protein I8751_26975 [Nostocaceae cyanobacterium CENA357]|uniref:Uncharacterized protein n=1 Tax=Atlanticothrix silvestris CENA357 TaxID=1725252 RepID=A0A8J7L4E9_9CYAN|nr:hypothetical protein [Atlanticothrix silvestris]MBH8555920.1 hypothetical protein [Atlanticothrix silvestris CENA357]